MTNKLDLNLDFLEGKTESEKDKVCSKCGEKIKSDNAFCSNCGNKLTTNENRNQTKISAKNHVHSIKKFLLLNLLTFGMYQAYWGWKNWEIVKRVTGLDLNSGIRGFFITFTSFSLFKEILTLAKKHGYKGSYNPRLLGACFLILNFIFNGIGKSDSHIDFTTLIVLIAVIIALITLVTSPVLKAMNYFLEHNNEDATKFEIKNNYFLIIVLVILFILVFLGSTNG